MRVLAIVAAFGCDAGTRATDRSTRDTVVAAPQDAVAAAPADANDKLELKHLGPGDPRFGDLDKQVIRDAIKRNLMQIAGCYEKHLTGNAKFDGKLVIKFTIDGSGRVVDASAAGVSQDIDRCVAGVIKQIEFPRPPDGMPLRITYPFWLDGAGS